MIIDQINASKKYLKLSHSLIAGSETGGQLPEEEQIQEKISESKNRRIPTVNLLLIFAVVVLAIVVLEYFI